MAFTLLGAACLLYCGSKVSVNRLLFTNYGIISTQQSASFQPDYVCKCSDGLEIAILVATGEVSRNNIPQQLSPCDLPDSCIE